MDDLNNKPVAIVLGGTYPHITLIQKLKERGYYTVLLDYYENPPAKRDADFHIQESTLDKEAVLKIAREKKADLVICTCIDQANATACYVAEELGLPKPYSYKTALTVTNKVLMKERMLENDIPTSKFRKVSKMEEIENLDLQFPLIVKPVDSNCSKGVRKIESQYEIKEYLQYALNISRDNQAIIEEYKTGKEIGIDCFIQNGEAHVLMMKERRKLELTGNNSQQIAGCIWPDESHRNNLSYYKKIARDIAEAFNLDNTPLMIQAIVENDDINVIEFAPRIGGGESFRIIQLSTGFDFINASIDSFLEMKTTVSFSSPNGYYAENFIYAKSSIFKEIIGFEELLELGAIEYGDAYKTNGMKIGDELSSNNRVGVFTVKADNRDKVQEKIKNALDKIEVYDVHGEPIMRKDIY